jgi:hypothetical protein
MKRMLQKLAATFLVVAVAGTCALAQSQSNRYVLSKDGKAAVSTHKEEKAVDAERDIYRATNTSTVTSEKVKIGTDVKRPMPNDKKAEIEAKNYPKATRVDLEAAKNNPVPKAKKRVNNTVNALPPNYKKESELTTKPNTDK